MRRASSMPWLRLDAAFTRDAKLRKAKATAVWPAVIGRMKAGLGFVSDDDLDPEILGEELFLPPEFVAQAVDGLKRVGLLVWAEDEVEVGGRVRTVRRVSGWTTPNWTDYQPDARGRSDKRDEAEGPREGHAVASRPSDDADGANGPRDETHEPNRPRDGLHDANVPRDCTPRDVTGRDGTGQEEETCRSPLAPARTHTREEAQKTADPTGSLAEIETLVLDCLKPEKRRGATFLSAMEVRKLASLVEQYGHDAVVDALGECGGADMPLAMAAKVLHRRAQERVEPRSNSPAPLPLYVCNDPEPERPVISAAARQSLEELTRSLGRGRHS